MKIVRIIAYTILILLFLMNLSVFGFHGSIIALTSSLTGNFDTQIFLYLTVSILLLGGFIALFFVKKINEFRLLLLLVLIILQIVYFKFSLYIPTVNKVLEIETCADIGGVWDNKTNNCVKN